MTQALLTQIRRAREIKVTVDQLTFICRRPTDEEALRLNREGSDYCQLSKEFVSGWEGVKESDIVGGAGSSDPVPFAKDLWSEWVVDRPDFWKPIGEAVLNAYTLHAGRLQEAEKN